MYVNNDQLISELYKYMQTTQSNFQTLEEIYFYVLSHFCPRLPPYKKAGGLCPHSGATGPNLRFLAAFLQSLTNRSKSTVIRTWLERNQGTSRGPYETLVISKTKNVILIDNYLKIVSKNRYRRCIRRRYVLFTIKPLSYIILQVDFRQFLLNFLFLDPLANLSMFIFGINSGAAALNIITFKQQLCEKL